MSTHKLLLSAHMFQIFLTNNGNPFPLLTSTILYSKNHYRALKFFLKNLTYERSQHMTPHNIHFASVYTTHMG